MSELLCIGSPLIRVDRVASTMEEIVRRAANGARAGTTVVAEEQTAGRGRSGRAWVAPARTGLLLSVLLRPAVPLARLGGLALVVGVAVAETIETAANLRPRLKWPNDVWLGDRKVAGILITTHGLGGGAFAVLGVGLNVNADREALPDGATSLMAETGRVFDRDAVLALLVARLHRAYRGFETSGGSPSLADWRRRAALVGEEVKIDIGGSDRSGVFHGVDDDGALVLMRADGVEERIVAGELTRGPFVVPSPRTSYTQAVGPHQAHRSPLR